jgi:hypothetical protein
MSLVIKHCGCCGIKYENYYKLNFIPTNGRYYLTMEDDFRTRGYLDGAVCVWCATFVPIEIIDLCLNVRFSAYFDGTFEWPVEYCREYPKVKERIAYVRAKQGYLPDYFSINSKPSVDTRCPRCSHALVEKTSESILGEKYSVKKCNNCGYCS